LVGTEGGGVSIPSSGPFDVVGGSNYGEGSAEFAAAFGKRLSSALRRGSTESGRAHVTSVLTPVNIADLEHLLTFL